MVSFASPLLGSLSSMQVYTPPQHTASSTAHLSPDIFSTHATEFVQSFLRGQRSQRGVFFPYFLVIFLCLLLFRYLQTINLFLFVLVELFFWILFNRMIQHAVKSQIYQFYSIAISYFASCGFKFQLAPKLYKLKLTSV